MPHQTRNDHHLMSAMAESQTEKIKYDDKVACRCRPGERCQVECLLEDIEDQLAADIKGG